MSIERYRRGAEGWSVRWRENGHSRSRLFRSRQDAVRFESELKRRKALRLPVPEVLVAAEQASMRSWAKSHKRAASDPRSWVYVMVAPELGHLKIGRSTNPDERLRTHATSAPVKLTTLLVVPGGAVLEGKLLEVTAPFAVSGAGSEWRSREALEVVFALIRERGGIG